MPEDSAKFQVIEGTRCIIETIRLAIDRVKDTIVIVTPVVIPEVLEKISEVAYAKKRTRFMFTSCWDLRTYQDIIAKLKSFGNIQCRQFKGAGLYWAVTWDAAGVALAPATDCEEDVVGFQTTLEGYIMLFAQFIGPVFLANSRPI